jgi:hypothetical protein
VTSVQVDWFAGPTCGREVRSLDRASRWALDKLAGRTVWSASARLLEHLYWASAGGVTTSWLGLVREEALIEVSSDDLIILDDRVAGSLSHLARESGAHVVVRAGESTPAIPAVDAYLMVRAGRVVAFLPAPSRISIKHVGSGRYEDLGWASALADVVHSDRGECVGGTLHPRPTVAPR